ncbi:hypothetical protein TNCV_3233261 [Trichonephila clavipes]|nr:hypothetical protein TNCV_3233261 [Trichonephila clavipes]
MQHLQPTVTSPNTNIRCYLWVWTRVFNHFLDTTFLQIGRTRRHTVACHQSSPEITPMKFFEGVGSGSNVNIYSRKSHDIEDVHVSITPGIATVTK